MLYTFDEQAIIAQCTPKGPGALALLRISGVNAFMVADSLSRLPHNKKISLAPSHTIAYGWVVDSDNLHVDQVLFLIMKGPHTFTGQDTVEISCHNNPFIIERIIELAISHGARLAHEGEFSKRAVLNNKMDLIQAEAINDLIHANNPAMLKQALCQVEGSLSGWITIIEEKLIQALAFSDATFEFLDEQDQHFAQEIAIMIEAVKRLVAQSQQAFDKQQAIRQGVRIALVGSVNAGKSSLFNTLLNKNRAIVTDIPGTTRDVIEVGLYKNGIYWTVIDTAGLRETDDIIEQEGIKKSFEEAQLADILLLIVDQSRPLSYAEQKALNELYSSFKHKIIVVANKADLPSASIPFLQDKKTIITTSNTSTANSDLESAIQEKIDTLFAKLDSPFLLNERHFSLLKSLEGKLNEITLILEEPVIAFELVSAHINEALANLSELTGKTISEKGLDAVFRAFCVGK